MIKALFFRSSYHFLGLVCIKFFSLLLFLFLARTLSSGEFGTLSFFITLLSLCTLVADWGLIQWSQLKLQQGTATESLNRVSEARVLTLLLSMLLFLGYSLLTHAFPLVLNVIFLFTLIPEAFLSVADSYYLVNKNIQKIIGKQVIKLLIPFMFYLVYPSNLSLTNILLSFMLGSLLAFFWYVPRQYYHLMSFSLSRAIQTLRDSTHYATLILASAMYSRGDQLVIESTLGRAAVGQYSIGYRYLDALSMFPSAFAQNFFHLSNEKVTLSLKRVTQIIGVMLVLGVVAGAMMFFASHALTVGLLGSTYAVTEELVMIFSIVTVLIFVNAPLATLVQSSSFLKSFLPWGMFNTGLNICLNVLLVPIYGITAAAWVMLFSEFTGLLINLYFVKKRVGR